MLAKISITPRLSQNESLGGISGSSDWVKVVVNYKRAARWTSQFVKRYNLLGFTVTVIVTSRDYTNTFEFSQQIFDYVLCLFEGLSFPVFYDNVLGFLCRKY